MNSSGLAWQDFSAWRALLAFAIVTAFTLYVAVAAFATVVAPPALFIFVAPLLAAVLAAAPATRAAPKRVILPLVYAAAILLPLWPVYLHLKLGPLPIITPPRLIIYALTAFWVYDMVASPLRRGQFVLAIKKGAPIAAPVIVLSILGALSVPFAQGKIIAGQEFLRQTTIWLLPFFVVLTYVRRPRELKMIIVALTLSASFSGAVALAEIASGKLLASFLSPLINDSGEWLRTAQEQKIRDGVFRAQAMHTHPLSLGEFLAMSAPLALAFTISARHAGHRLLWGLCLLLITGGAFATSSRGAMLAIVFGLTAAATIFSYRFLRRAAASRFRPVAGLVVAIMLAASPAMMIGAHGVVTGSAGASAARSSESRVDQIELAWPKILKRPVTGYGTGRAARVLGYWGATLTIDNYYLSLGLDLGFPGPIMFFSILMFTGATCLRRSAGVAREDAALYVGLASAAAAFALTRSIVSMTGNISILYLILGAVAGVAVSMRKRQRRPTTTIK